MGMMGKLADRALSLVVPRADAGAVGTCYRYIWVQEGTCAGIKYYEYKITEDCTGGYEKSRARTGNWCCTTATNFCNV